jgi:hypothetical protein
MQHKNAKKDAWEAFSTGFWAIRTGNVFQVKRFSH